MGDPAANAEVINRFYSAFARRDATEMATLYAPDATFSDPVFRDLRGAQVTSMWRMLCERGTDLEIRHSLVEADAETGSAHWDADYTFSATGRSVHNSIDASFVFRDGLIAEHVDRFSLWAWTRQALGPVGLLLGWSPPLQAKVRRQARAGLEQFMSSAPGEAAESAPGANGADDAGTR